MTQKKLTFVERIYSIFKEFVTDYLIAAAIYLNTCFSLHTNKNLNNGLGFIWLIVFFLVFQLTITKYLPETQSYGKYTKQIRFVLRILFILLYVMGYGFNIIKF